MPVIFPMQPPFVVEVGPDAGVYFSKDTHAFKTQWEDKFESPIKSIFEQNPWLDEGGGG